MKSDREFSERAVRRLRIAAALMRLSPSNGEMTAVQCVRLLERIHALAAVQRERLRARVDWVEGYERAEGDLDAHRSHRRPAVHTNRGPGGDSDDRMRQGRAT
jgi:hypothetical protein